jgi:hypothetical protein
MLKLEVALTLALVFCSASALARGPEAALPDTVPGFEEEQPRALHRLPLGSDVRDAVAPPTPEPKANQAASDGVLSPFTSPVVIPAFRASAQSYAGYDGAIAGARAHGAAEGRLTSFLALRVEFEHGPATGTQDRVNIGGRLGILTQRQYGIDLGAGLFYQPKDFRGEGNVAFGLMVARHFERLGLFVNTLFGSDPEGDDQLLELRLGSLYAANDWLSVGMDGRSRMNFSEDPKRLKTLSVDWEMQAAPTAIISLGQFSVMALLGPSLVKETPALGEPTSGNHLHSGLLAMAGAGGAF